VLVVQRVFRAKRTNLHEKYDYPMIDKLIESTSWRAVRVVPRELFTDPSYCRKQC